MSGHRKNVGVRQGRHWPREVTCNQFLDTGCTSGTRTSVEKISFVLPSLFRLLTTKIGKCKLAWEFVILPLAFFPQRKRSALNGRILKDSAL